MKYIVSCISIVNDIIYADKEPVYGFLGGGVYAASGIKLYTDDVVFVTTGGSDYFDYYGEYFDSNGYDRSAVYCTLPVTHKTTLVYEPDGSWNEHHVAGEDAFDRYLNNTSRRAAYFMPFCGDDTAGIFMDSNSGDPIWQETALVRRCAPNAKIMWEVQTFDSMNPEIRDVVRCNIKLCDMFSMNLREASFHFEKTDESELIKTIQDFGVPCFLRAGERGGFFVSKGGCWFSPSVGVENAVDATGCGNCSSAASLYGWCEGYDPKKLVKCANIAAGFNVREHGPMHNPASYRAEALRLLNQN